MKEKGSFIKSISWFSTAVGALSIVAVGLWLAMDPVGSQVVIERLFDGMLNVMGAWYLWIALGGLALLVWLAFSRFGNIRLGDGPPEFSKFQIFCMVVCAGFGAATLYWGFIETTYYYIQPPFNIQPQSSEAMEWSLAYNFFHWGPSAWAMFTICAVPVCYTFYIQKKHDLKFSSICNFIAGNRIPKFVCTLLDILFIFITLGSVSISLGLSLPMLTSAISSLCNISEGGWISILLVVLMTAVCCISSYSGIKNGMSRLSDMNIKLCGILVLIVFLIGPKQFTIDNITNACGILTQNFFRMSTWLAPITRDSFPRVWTVFYIAYWLAFGPFVGIFLAKICRGHRLKDMIGISIGAGTIGTFAIHGVLQSYTLHLQITGEVDAAGMLAAGYGGEFVVTILNTMPFPKIMISIFIITCALFMVTTLDSCAFSISSVTCHQLDKGGNPPVVVKVFWCLVLSLLPLVLTLINASLDTIKTIAIIVTVPISAVIVFMLLGAIKGFIKNEHEDIYSR